ncbi:alkaline phosphatase D family protein [Allostreptomyces psammosilenae]|uniref:Alkaline phosphatase D n=1 Tax=Allostreptomyces psammosilenae TaxID=1892865 RepID=A0A853A175_9ACTN|nr:alkaline phosphatase D family protein [Allostreptomyces psammosilenae]NYI04262.1 alkaline phosphatase D [Allostreptomyces psammosilenae]
MTEHGPTGPARRSLLAGLAAAPLAAAGGLVLPASTAAASPAAPAQLRWNRPQVSHGVQAGDVTAGSALIWARADRPARMVVEVAATEEFRRPRRFTGPLLTPDTDLTGTTALRGLPAGEQVHYRVVLADPDDPRATGEPVAGTFRTASHRPRDVRFTWSGDQAGQGWGINPDLGGFRIYDAMARLDPDFFLCSGDTIYADGPIQASVTLPDGRVWRNVTTEEKAKVAETLAEYRGNFRYNLLDENLRRFNAQVPSIIQWDDHEVTNNWYPGELLEDSRYTVKEVDVLAARARQAFSEYFPISTLTRPSGRVHRVIHHGPLLDVFVLDMRTYRDRNSAGTETAADGGILGREQLAWLKKELSRSTATWKVLAADMPIGLIVPDGSTAIEAIAQGDPGAPLGRELEIAELLTFIKRRRITGTVWITADVHYTAAHHYDPARAAYTDFDPFWEFVSGPLNAGAFGPNRLDGTFGPREVFVKAPPVANTSPLDGYQFFGEVHIDAESAEFTVRLREHDGTVLFTQVLQPGR